MRGRIVAVAVLALLEGVASVVPLLAVVGIARALLPASGPVDAAGAQRAVLVAAAGGVAVLVLGLAGGVLAHLADNDLQLAVRTALVRHVRTLPLGWFDERSSGALTKAVEGDVSALHELVAHMVRDLVGAVTVPLVSLVVLLRVDVPMALACLAAPLLGVVVYPLAMRDGARHQAGYERARVALESAAVEQVQGIAVVKAFGGAGRYRSAARELVRVWDAWMRAAALPTAFVEFVTSPVVVLLVVCGAALWRLEPGAGGPDPVTVLPAVLLGLGLTSPLLRLGYDAEGLRDALRARSAILALLREPPMPVVDPGTVPVGGGVELRDVTFGYRADHPVLHEVAVACAPGTLTALVGPSGAGKSTLARLVARFHDVQQGAVLVGGADVREVAPDRLYRHVGLVLQENTLLRASVRDNIRLTRPGAGDDEVRAAAVAAQVHGRILRLPRGYDSVVGEDAHLSGGEAQRVCVARGLLTDAPVLVLDEATAFADPDSEAALQDALSALAVGRTVLVVAHRLHTVVGADRILVVDGGRIVERGRHGELLTAGGTYARLWAAYTGDDATEVVR